MTISVKVNEVILFLGIPYLICIMINETATSGSGNRSFLSPLVLIVLKKIASVWQEKYPSL